MTGDSGQKVELLAGEWPTWCQRERIGDKMKTDTSGKERILQRGYGSVERDLAIVSREIHGSKELWRRLVSTPSRGYLVMAWTDNCGEGPRRDMKPAVQGVIVGIERPPEKEKGEAARCWIAIANFGRSLRRYQASTKFFVLLLSSMENEENGERAAREGGDFGASKTLPFIDVADKATVTAHYPG
ncbi:hypothetical protein HETIRDRAFT_116318 [Heterobasidion irregulare TC 32-1]|uniref:Uncharacterized protein n=1 Tax=Heterobasidion irregulare (strain TC 32-1) TaxID=747525 RepID=W4KEI0_HETIT|nr:uncharacterized protein HETIRDRAFT_116318 [Heterobasidion irregulare TC 32-1]ETW83725.1 hypothetical protein HETIRDRAFT_116318 [Heterobasidion irregulare TC 32-1]